MIELSWGVLALIIGLSVFIGMLIISLLAAQMMNNRY
jgi:hypothetical protein